MSAMSRELEIVCVACKCDPDDEKFDQRYEKLPDSNSDEFSTKANEFRKKHNHAKCIVRTVKDYKHTEDKEFRKKLLSNS